MPESIEVPQFVIPGPNWESFQTKFEKLARRALKLGVGTVSYTVVNVEPRVRVRWDAMAFLPDQPPADSWIPATAPIPASARRIESGLFRTVTVTGDRPRLGGWRFIGTLQFLAPEEGQPLVLPRTVPGETIPESFRSVEQRCDHCHLTRYRTDTFVVAHDDGRTAQVGRNCLKDFTGHANPEDIARFAAYLMDAADLASSSDDDEGSGGGGGREIGLFVPTVLALTSATIIATGWTSRTKAREFPGLYATADAVLGYLLNKDGVKEQVRDSVVVTVKDEQVADEAMAWIETQNIEGRLDDYLYNLYAATRVPVTGRTAGIVCSLIPTYLRAQERMIERQKRLVERSASEWFGTVGKRESFTVVLLGEPRAFDGEYGTSYLYKFLRDGRDEASWFASSPIDAQPGDTLTVKATVKKHEDYKGVKQTMLTRVAVG